MSSDNSRQSPVIIITGTPGTGKSTHAHLLSEESPVPLQHINVGEWVKERDLHEGYDQEWQSYTVDEDRVGVLYPVKVLRLGFDYRVWLVAGRVGTPSVKRRNHTRLAHVRSLS
jgi:AAA domain